MKNKVFTKLSGSFGKMGLSLKKHSPEILLVAGVVGLVGAAVTACRATTKVGAILEERKKQLDDITAISAEGNTDEYTIDDKRRDTVIVNAKSALKLARLYAPAVAIGAASIVMIFSGHNILRKRSAALAAAYAAVENGFNEYKKRVAERFGADVEKEIRLGAQTATVSTMDPETGTPWDENIAVADKTLGGNPYTMIFDGSCELWERDHEYNMLNLRAEQQYANDRLRSRGYLFLNDIFERLGVRGNKMGQVVGWVYDPKNNNGDNFVDFGITEMFIDGKDEIVLEFNPQGNILDLIK